MISFCSVSDSTNVHIKQAYESSWDELQWGKSAAIQGKVEVSHPGTSSNGVIIIMININK